MEKTCTKCGISKPIEDYSRTNRTLSGRVSKCKECVRIYNKQYQARANELSLTRYHRLQEPKKAQKAIDLASRLAKETKACPRCGTDKHKSEFANDKNRIDGLRVYCRVCSSSANKKYRQENPDAASASTKNWAIKNPEKVRAKSKKWALENRERKIANAKSWREMNRQYLREYWSQRRCQPEHRIAHSMSVRLYSLITDKKNTRTEDLIGYKKEELLLHLERQFLDGMSWENYGQWHVDHIVPVSAFNIRSKNDIEEIRACWALSNLRPLWASDNIRKSNNRVYLI